MAERDQMGRAVISAAAVLQRVRKRVRARVPYGPGKVQMSPAELRKAIERAGPTQAQQILSMLDNETALRVLLGAKRVNQEETMGGV